MAEVNYFDGTYFRQPWKDVIDPSAILLEIPYGTVSPIFNGWAYRNTDGSYTVFLGEDPISFDENGTASGVVTNILWLSSLTLPITEDDVLAIVFEGFSASGIQDAYQAGGQTFAEVLFVYDDIVDMDSPSFGGLQWSAPVIETFTGNDTVYGSLHHDTVYAGSGSDTVWGDEGNDRIWGGTGDDTLYGEQGADSIYGESGNDYILGGAGRDMLFGGSGNDFIGGGAGDDVIEGGDGNDWLTGNGGADTLYGGAGNDQLDGGNGADLIYGGAGNDQIFGGDGYNTLYGGDGADFMRGGRHADVMRGDNGRDTLVGAGGDDTLYGDGGDDRILGGAGDDLLFGGAGDDYLHGGSGTDTALFLLPRVHYAISIQGATVTVTSVEGVDTLVDIERLQFTDQVMWV